MTAKTVLIAKIVPYNINNGNDALMITSDHDDSNDCNVILQKPKRKRMKLDHMTDEEKLIRRKLKNRVAAQSARDRKKMKMQELENKLFLLNKEKKILINNNNILSQKCQHLETENMELKRQLVELSERAANDSKEQSLNNVTSTQSNDSIESAELINDPQPKEQESLPQREVANLTHLMMPCVYLLAIMNLMQSLTFSKNVLKSYSNLQLMKPQQNQAQSVQSQIPEPNHQNPTIWNPSKT